MNNAQAYYCNTSSQSITSASTETLTVLDLEHLQQAYIGSTITMGSHIDGSSTQYSFIDIYVTRTLATTSPSPSSYLAEIQTNPPACVNTLNTTCTRLYAAAQDCWSEVFPPGPQQCYCDALVNNNCPTLCFDTRNDRRDYFDWVMGLCSTFNTSGKSFTENWPEINYRTETYYEDLIPWTWTITPIANSSGNLTVHCPSNGEKIASFAVINIIVGISTLILGRRTVVKRLTCGILGNPGSPTWPLVSVFVVGVNLLANLINAAIVSRDTGYIVPPVGTLVLFWMSRPRLAWMATALAPIEQEKSMYISLAASALLTESILQAIGAAFIGRTVVYAAQNGFYYKSALKYAPKRKEALIMFAGALLWIVAIGFFYIYVIWNYLGVGTIVGKFHTWASKSLKTFGEKTKVQIEKLQSKWRSNNDNSSTHGNYSPANGNHNHSTDHIDQYHHHRNLPNSHQDQYHSYRNPVYPPRGPPPRYERDRLLTVNNTQSERRISDEDQDTSVEAEKENLDIDEVLDRMGLNAEIMSRISSVFTFMLLPFIGQWLFWVGFVGLYADR